MRPALVRSIASALALLTLAASLVRIPAAHADPTITNNANGTSDAVWNFATPADYVRVNASIAGGIASLASQTTWWNSTTAADFSAPDTEANIDRARWPGDVAMATTSGPSTLLTLQPGPAGIDTYSDRNNPAANHGADTTILLDGRNPQDYPLLQFDLSSIPAGAVIDSAVFGMYESAGIGNPVTASAYQVTAQWDEMQATWNNRLAATPWVVPGGDHGTHVVDVVVVDNTVGWKSWNVTNLVDLWYRGRITNYGLILQAPNPGATSTKTFFSSDYVVDPTRRPKLDVTYRVLAASATYASRIGGPGTMAAWQTIAWNATERSLATDEFAGASLDPKWTWTNTPPAWDVGTTTPGSLHLRTATGVDLNGGTFTGQVLAETVVGDFTATMKFSANPTVAGQKAGLMVLVGPRDWYSVGTGNVAGVVNWRVRSTADAVSTNRVDVASGNPIPAWVRLQRVGATFTASTSPDGTTWTVRDAYTPAFEYPLGLRLAGFAADGLSGTALNVDVDYVRVSFGNDATVSVSTRVGDVTPVDGTWSGWSASYPTPSGSAMAGNSKYIEYRLSLAVVYPDHVPVVGDANLSWFRYLPAGTVETNDLVPTDLAAWGNLMTVQALNGQTIAYEYSLDSGGSWSPVAPPVDLSAVTIATGKIRFRATLSTGNTLITPTLSEIRLRYLHRLDHFDVTASATATAGASFSVTVTAKDVLNATIDVWTGTVTLAATLLDGITPGGGVLGTTSVAIAAGGSVTLATETYTKAETIRVRATFGSASGLSGGIVVSPGPVTRVVVTPDNVTLLPFDTQSFSGQAFDAYDNPVPGVNFNWTVVGGVGSLNASSGPSVVLTASPPPANGTLQMAFGAVIATAQVHVAAGTRPWIAIASPLSGAHVTGVVPIAYTNSSGAVSVRFEYDAGAGWTLIGTTAVLNGSYAWDTSALNFVGGSLRAIVTNNRTISNTTVVAPIEVDNTPPTITLGVVTDNQAGNGTLTITYATDPDVVRVDLTYFDGAWKPIGTDATVDGSYVWTPGVPINGVTLRAVAVDDVGLIGTDQKQGVGTFVAGSNPPTIAAIPDVHIPVAATYRLNLTFYVSDPDTPRSALAVSDSDAANVTALPGAYPALNITYAAAGMYLVTLWVSDGTDTAWTIVRVIASAAQRPPTLVASLPSVAFDEDTIALDALGAPATAFFLDPDGDPMAFTVLDETQITARVNGNATIDLWAPANWSGSEWLRLRATDPSGGFAEAAFLATVRPVNDPPILFSAFTAVAFDEDTTSLNVFGGDATIHFFDVDGDALTITVLGTGIVSARVNPGNTIDLWAAANWSGSQTLRVRATDPSGSFAEGTFLVTVRPVNDPPIVAAALPAVAFDEDTVSTNALGGPVTPRFFDVDGDPLAFAVLGGVQVTARLNADRTVDLWGPANWSGTETLRVRATDSSGAYVEAPLLVIVRPVDDAPVLLPLAALTINEGETRSLDLSPFVSDIDTNRSQLVVTTDSPYVQVTGFALTMAFPSDRAQAQFTVMVSDGTLAASQVVRVTIVPPWWKSVYFLPVPPSLLAVVIGVFVQRSRWRPTKAFLVDERNEMIREFTLDRNCDVTFDQVRQAGALDATDKSVKVSKYHAQTVRGDALGLVLLAYGPVTADQIEFAREMLVNIQDKFDGGVKARIEEARSSQAAVAAGRGALESDQTALAARATAVASMYESVTTGQARMAEEARAIHAHATDIERREAALLEGQEAHEHVAVELEGRVKSLDARASEVQSGEAMNADRATALDALEKDTERLRETLPEREAAVEEREARTAALEKDVRNRAYEVAQSKKEADEKAISLARDQDDLAREKASLELSKKDFEAQTMRFGQDIQHRSQEMDLQRTTLQEVQSKLTEAREAFETMRQDKTQWIASKDIELEAREHTLNEKEAAVRSQAETNAQQLTDLAAREETYEVEGDRLEKARAELEARKSENEATAKALDAKAAELREVEARKAEEYRLWETTLTSQQSLLKEQKEASEKESADQRRAMEAKREEFEVRDQDLAAREAKARASVEWSMRAQDEVKEREAAVAEAMKAAKALQTEGDLGREEVTRRTADLQSQERHWQDDVQAREAQIARRAEGLKVSEAAFAERSAVTEREIADRQAEVRLAESEAANKVESIEQKAVVLLTREAQLDSLKESLAVERADLDGRSAHLEARRLEVTQAAQQNEEKAARLLEETESTSRTLDAREAQFRTDRERFERESQSLQGSLGAKATELASREQGLGAREREVAARAESTDARFREVDSLERQVAARVQEATVRDAATEEARREVDARTIQLDEATKRFAIEDAEKRLQWETSLDDLKSRETRSKTDVETQLAALKSRAADLDRRERELTGALAHAESERARLAESSKANAAKEAEAGAAWSKSQVRLAELEGREAELGRAREGFEAEMAAWLPRREEEQRQIEVTRDAIVDMKQRAEQLLSDAERRAAIAAEAEKAAGRRNEDLSRQQASIEARRGDLAQTERELEARTAQLEESTRKFAGRELELEALTKEYEARSTKVEAREKTVAAAKEEARTKRLEVDREAAEIARRTVEVEVREKEAESRTTEAEARLLDVVQREKDVKAKESEVRAREKAIADHEKDLVKREAAIAGSDSALKERAQEVERMRLEAEGSLATVDEDRKVAKAAKTTVEALGEKAAKMIAQAEAQQAEVAKNMKVIQKKAMDTLDREERTRKREAEIAEKEKIVESKFEILEGKERSFEIEREASASKLARKEAELEKMRARVSEAEQGSRPAAALDDRERDLENRLKIIQRKAMELLDREEKVRIREEEMKGRAQKPDARA